MVIIFPRCLSEGGLCPSSCCGHSARRFGLPHCPPHLAFRESCTGLQDSSQPWVSDPLLRRLCCLVLLSYILPGEGHPTQLNPSKLCWKTNDTWDSQACFDENPLHWECGKLKGFSPKGKSQHGWQLIPRWPTWTPTAISLLENCIQFITSRHNLPSQLYLVISYLRV